MPTRSSERMGWLRAAVGVALLVAPGPPLRLSGREAPTSASLLLMRTIGIRDLVIGLGTVAASRSGVTADARRWTTMALVSDSLDVAASLAAWRGIGKRDALVAAALAGIFAVKDVYVLGTLSQTAEATAISD